ncbi:MAG: hypothetical protein LBH53_00485 [Puniceicoccales bacterium]|jgi:hypothetical protein|nr:hypothetical protein [Puniceicoccales bacterium]
MSTRNVTAGSQGTNFFYEDGFYYVVSNSCRNPTPVQLSASVTAALQGEYWYTWPVQKEQFEKFIATHVQWGGGTIKVDSIDDIDALSEALETVVAAENANPAKLRRRKKGFPMAAPSGTDDVKTSPTKLAERRPLKERRARRFDPQSYQAQRSRFEWSPADDS